MQHLGEVQLVGDVHELAMEIPNADIETLRSLGDNFRQRYPTSGTAVLWTGTTVSAFVTPDLVKQGLKASDLIAAIGGRGGGRPGMAQGSLPEGTNVDDASTRLAAAVKSHFEIGRVGAPAGALRRLLLPVPLTLGAIIGHPL